MQNIPPALEKYIATRDKNNMIGITTLKQTFEELLKWKTIEVGGRSTCGAGKADPTWKFFTSWNEIVKKANSLGFNISVERLKHENKYATSHGGFWNSNIYKIQ